MLFLSIKSEIHPDLNHVFTIINMTTEVNGVQPLVGSVFIITTVLNPTNTLNGKDDIIYVKSCRLEDMLTY